MFFSAQMGQPMAKSLLDGTFDIRDFANFKGIYLGFLIWNVIEVAMNLLVCFYLVHYELRSVYSTVERELSNGKDDTSRAKV